MVAHNLLQPMQRGVVLLSGHSRIRDHDLRHTAATIGESYGVYCTALHCTALHCTARGSVLHCTGQCTALRCTALHMAEAASDALS